MARSVWQHAALLAFFAAALIGSAAAEGPSNDDIDAVFEDLDANKDGRLDREELLKTEDDEDTGEGSFSAMLSKHFAAADADGDGSLDKKEMAVLIDLFSKDDEL
mmetsp:Transcript_33045/g.93973  ORF Transcript_33045/g.93973 Transcript_33045/m.93973 type:complete len:105 (-) Transcript_33045:110-424(-)